MSRHRTHRADSNHTEIMKAYRRLGCYVTSTTMVGNDFPDLVCSNYGLTWTVEVKAGNGKPTEGQQKFVEESNGSHFIVRDLNGVAMSINVMRDKANRLI